MSGKEEYSNEFKEKRKKDGLKLAEKIRSATRYRYKFKGQYFEDIIYQLSRVYCLIDHKSIIEASKTGFISIEDYTSGQNVGAFYCREYIDLTEDDIDLLTIDSLDESVYHSYDIEIMVKQNDSDRLNKLIDFMNSFFGPADLLVKPEHIPNCHIFIWGAGKSYYGDLIASLHNEFGARSCVTELSSTDSKDNSAILLKS